ncbi:MAG: DUF1822 family protein [Elainellaceae cyanobacterium]
MMNSTDDDFSIMVPLTLKAHSLAEQFRQQQPNLQHAKRVYLNTLAVYAVNFYLTCLGIETDLEASNSWNLASQVLSDTADLMIRGVGKLECRPVLPDDQICYIPPETRSDRIGYVAVKFDSDLEEAAILGFVPSSTTAEVPLNQLRSLDDLIDYLSQVQQSSQSPVPVQLQQWLQNTFESGWQSIEDLFRVQQPALSFRSPDLIQLVPISSAGLSASRGKLLELRTAPQGEQIALLVGLMVTPNPEMDIWVRLCPVNHHARLPPELEVLILDEADIPVMQAQSRNTEMIQLKFGGKTGEKFSIRVVLGDIIISETFMV